MTWRTTLAVIIGIGLIAFSVLGASTTTATRVPPRSSPTAADPVGPAIPVVVVPHAGPQGSPNVPDPMSAPAHVTSNTLCSTVVPRLKERAAEGKAARGKVVCMGSVPGAQNDQVLRQPTPHD